MKQLLLLLALLAPFGASASAEEEESNSPLRMVFTYAGYEDCDWTSLDKLDADEESWLVMSQDSIQLCYEPGKKEACSFLSEKFDRDYGDCYLDEESQDPVLNVMFAWNISWTEFEFHKDIPECSNEWMKKVLETPVEE